MNIVGVYCHLINKFIAWKPSPMHRLLIRCGSLSLHRNKLGAKTVDLTRHISSSLCSMKHSDISISSSLCSMQQCEITDDWKETPTYCENYQTRRLTMRRFKNFLEKILSYPSSQATEICRKYPEFGERTLNDIKKNVALVTQNGITTPLIAENPWMLTTDNGW